jgi:hypothetical protein
MLRVDIPPRWCRVGVGSGLGSDYAPDRQAVLCGELEIALVVRRHRHHRAFAVGHQYIVRDPHFEFLASQRVDDVEAGRHALFFLGRQFGLHHRAALALLDEGGELRVCGRRPRGE